MVIYGKYQGVDIWFNVVNLNDFWHADPESDLPYVESVSDAAGWCKKKDVVLTGEVGE
jgi:hypothetical protein